MSSESSLPKLVLILLAMGCADVERGSRPPVPEAGPEAGANDGGAVSFATVRPLLVDGCQRCHAPGQQAGNTALLFTGDAMAELASVRGFVDTASPARSRLLAKTSGQGHGGGAIYRPGSAEYAALLAWIEGGAAP
jgi:hypothetical protein